MSEVSERERGDGGGEREKNPVTAKRLARVAWYLKKCQEGYSYPSCGIAFIGVRSLFACHEKLLFIDNNSTEIDSIWHNR